jgi:hypothetical protein
MAGAKEKKEMTEGEEGLGFLTVRHIAEYANTPLYLILKKNKKIIQTIKNVSCEAKKTVSSVKNCSQ